MAKKKRGPIMTRDEIMDGGLSQTLGGADRIKAKRKSSKSKGKTSGTGMSRRALMGTGLAEYPKGL